MSKDPDNETQVKFLGEEAIIFFSVSVLSWWEEGQLMLAGN